MGSIAVIAASLSGAGRAAENAAPVFPEMLNTVLAAACRSTAAPEKAVIVSADHAAALFQMEKAWTDARIAARHLLKKMIKGIIKASGQGSHRRLNYSGILT